MEFQCVINHVKLKFLFIADRTTQIKILIKILVHRRSCLES
ncbi:hypothetical protein CAMGR0001_0376 [Campylobacter gracilis RM3268]|uniref:Uncharacterized protein n=1 Tax=Campylobacter gracilis RM3268 TaxID=553220 RepID=C8PHD2_9BACT|nr:hypothetical protein CAMGR0001_0376 [Campylobacter gracilis RM3268]